MLTERGRELAMKAFEQSEKDSPFIVDNGAMFQKFTDIRITRVKGDFFKIEFIYRSHVISFQEVDARVLVGDSLNLAGLSGRLPVKFESV